MSDLADRAAESCGAVEGAGGSFGGHGRDARATGLRLPACSCGGRPVYGPHPPMRGVPCETLACGSCGNAVGPFSARYALAVAWRMGGWRAGEVH